MVSVRGLGDRASRATYTIRDACAPIAERLCANQRSGAACDDSVIIAAYREKVANVASSVGSAAMSFRPLAFPIWHGKRCVLFSPDFEHT